MDEKIRLHSLAVEQGYIKQQTIDFFLKYLFGVYQDSVLSFATSYQIIKQYINGEKNFKNIDLTQAPLSKVSFKKIVLDGSNLRQAKLNNCNLSHSSLVRFNLSLADLESANFQSANLQEADLRGANLSNVNLSGADLRGARFESASFNDVYYDQQTSFNANFDPIKAGWKLKSQE